MITDAQYGSQMEGASTEFSGWVADIEILEIENLALVGTKLNYKLVNSQIFSTLSTQNFTINQ